MKWPVKSTLVLILVLLCVLFTGFSPSFSFPAKPVVNEIFNDWSNALEENFSKDPSLFSLPLPRSMEISDKQMLEGLGIIKEDISLDKSYVLPDYADLLQYMPQVSRQAYNDCTTFAIAYYCMSYWNFRRSQKFPVRDNRYLGSSLYLFNQCNGGDDIPISLAKSYYLTRVNGCSTLNFFSPGNCRELPDVDIQIKSLEKRTSDLKYIYASRNHSEGRYDPGGDPLSLTEIRNIKYYLAGGIPVVASFYVYPPFLDATGLSQGAVYFGPSTPYPEPSSIHAITIAGYLDDPDASGGGFFYLRNSWGTDWGAEGNCWVTYDFMKNHSIEAYPVKGFHNSPTFFLVLKVKHPKRGDLKVELLVDGEKVLSYSPYDLNQEDRREDLQLAMDLTDFITESTSYINLEISDMSEEETGVVEEAFLVRVLDDMEMSVSASDSTKMAAVDFELDNETISDRSSIVGTIALDEVEFTEIEPLSEPDEEYPGIAGGGGGGCTISFGKLSFVFLLLGVPITFLRKNNRNNR